MRIEPFQAVFPNFDYITSVDAFFETVKFEYPQYRQSGFFQKASQEGLYVYEISRAGRTHTGLICCVDIEEYKKGNIKKHENTLPAKEQQQMHLMISRNAIVKPILITHPTIDQIDVLLAAQKTEKQAFYSTSFSNGESHKMWQIINGSRIEEIQSVFAKHVHHAYIADGHHRCSTSSLLHDRMKEHGKSDQYNKLFVTYFPESQLEVHDYNRVVECLDDVSLSRFMAQLSNIFRIKPLKSGRKPRQKHELTFCINKEWYSLKWKKKVLKQHENDTVILDAQLLDELVFEKILGFEDVRTDSRLKYIEGPKGINAIRQQVNKNDKRVGFCLYPANLGDLIEVADRCEVMPPKSTWFEPRVKNGLLALELEPGKEV